MSKVVKAPHEKGILRPLEKLIYVIGLTPEWLSAKKQIEIITSMQEWEERGGS